MNYKTQRDVWLKAQLVDDKRHHVAIAIERPDGRSETRRVGLRELHAGIHLIDLMWMLAVLETDRPKLSAKELVSAVIASQLGLELSTVSIISHDLPLSGSHALMARQPAAWTR